MDLLNLIREKKSQIVQLQQELNQALAELTGDLPVPPPTRRRGLGGKRSGRRAALSHGNGGLPGIVPTSSMGLAVEEMREAGKPLHVDEMIRRAKAKGYDIKKSTLVGNLSRYNKAKSVVYRHKPSVYGLLEMRR